MAYKGKYKPKNPQKYKGNPENIIYRSLWERKVMVWLDKSPNIVWWTSEELAITYFNPVDKNLHKYYPDFVFLQKTNEKDTKTVMLEVKPKKQTKPPRKSSKKSNSTYLEELGTYAKNTSKWKAAKSFCKARGWDFKIITEKDVNF